jgi:hypothetical protein
MAALQAVLDWTGGQPFLTQKICQLIRKASEPIPTGGEAQWVENLVRAHIISNWKALDEPEHLFTIGSRLLWSSQCFHQLLLVYRQILVAGEVKAFDVPEQMELRKSGLVIKQQGKLRVSNRIYASVFNSSWVDEALAEVGWLRERGKTKVRVMRGLRLHHRGCGNPSFVDLNREELCGYELIKYCT